MIPLSDFLILTILALLIFGPRRLPEIGRMIGKGLAEFRKASNELRRTINAELALEEQDRPRPPDAANRGPRIAPPVPPVEPPTAAAGPAPAEVGEPGSAP